MIIFEWSNYPDLLSFLFTFFDRFINVVLLLLTH